MASWSSSSQAHGSPAVPAIAGVDALNTQQGLALEPSAIDCGDTSRILGDDTTLVCALTDPDTGDLFDATFTITDLDAGAFDIGVTPR